ncbi:MAG: response regulator [Actinobacteria bacterium]|nr:response regulator [Actinomycetota bacterium]
MNLNETKKVRVLIADDSPTVRLMLCRMLEMDSGIKVVGTASDGREAVEQVAALEPDLVTMDVNMPIMDGLAAIEHIMAYNPSSEETTPPMPPGRSEPEPSMSSASRRPRHWTSSTMSPPI